MTRCDLTGLLADQCAHCRGLPDLPDIDPEPRHGTSDGYGRTISAHYDGSCAECGGRVHKGEQITRHGDGYVGECCLEVAR